MIYVHDNPQKLEFNAQLYVFMRNWYCPDLPDHVFRADTWFKVPAIRVESQSKVSYTIINNKFDLVAMMIISDNGRLLKATRTKVDQKVADAQLREIEREAFDISNWEKANQRAFPYADMFEGGAVSRRYQAKHGKSSDVYFSASSSNPLFTEIKKTVSGRPCNCGKSHYLG